MKTVATIALAFVVLITAFVCFWCTICAVSSGFSASDRWSFAIADLIDIAIMVGAVLVIARLNKKPKPL